MTTVLDEPCYVYHCYVDDECVYVGASLDPVARLGQHTTSTPWAHRVTRVEKTRYASGREALVAEAADIASLRPRWNVNGRGPRSSWQLSDYVEVLMAVTFRHSNKIGGLVDEKVTRRVERMVREVSLRWPDVAPAVLSDLELEAAA